MPGNGDRSLSDVLQDVVGNVQGIIRSEARLAKAEIREEAGQAGKAAGIAGLGGALSFYAAGFLLLACLYALELVVASWLAALIMMFIVGAIAAVVLRAGIQRLKRVHPRPDKTIDTIKENVEWAKDQIR